jgi:ketosteroid isomerase-like protein
MRALLLSTLLLVPAAAGAQSEVEAGPAADLVALEAAYAADVAAQGVRDGTLAHLAEEAVVFRPLPVPARAWYQAQSAADFGLAWQPWFQELAGSGDFGYTVGSWTSSALAAGSRPDSHGWYATVWIRTGDGQWRVLADHGIGIDQAAAAPAQVDTLGATRSPPAGGTWLMNTRYQSLLEAALRLPQAQAAGAGPAIERGWMAEDLLVLRQGSLPLRGHDATRAILLGDIGASPAPVTVMAASGDLGMSLGGEPGAGAYLRVWRHHPDAGWQLAVEVGTPVSVAPGAGAVDPAAAEDAADPDAEGADAAASDVEAGGDVDGADPATSAENEGG